MLTKSGPPTALAGDAAGFDYSLTVTNQGPSDNVGGFVLSDMLPSSSASMRAAAMPPARWSASW